MGARMTPAIVRELIALVIASAERAGVETLSYSGAPYKGLELYSAGGYYRLHVDMLDGTHGVHALTEAGGSLRSIATYLRGMLGVLESINRRAEFDAQRDRVRGVAR